ncbi:hypothetical protein V6N11_063827 [Hibiscus sabdariffa]|uniref:Uncharacterized protein n=2 Tax=Hibiscus sabdariffa TaxID=183260 RepID=A0ABR2PMJ2_9ROSI
MSENQGDKGSPRSLVAGTPSGRPPDFFQEVVVNSGDTEEGGKLVHHVQSGSLERPRSPVSLDSQGQCKKSRGTGVHDPIDVSDAMEMEDLQREQVTPVVARLESEGQQMGTNVEEGCNRMSYANAVNGAGRKIALEQLRVDEFGGDPNKISVSDDDCVIDRTGKFPRIEFSEKEACDKSENRVQETTDRTMHNVIGKKSTVGSSDKGELFGPWMTVDNRRKRSNNGGSMLATGLRKSDVRAATNRFAALGEERVELMEEHGNVDNVVSGLLSPISGQPRNVSEEGGVLVSKEGSSSRSHLATGDRVPNRGLEKTVVLPMVEGQQVSVVQHAPMGSGQRHTSFSLLEKGHGRTGVEGIALGKTRGGRRSGREMSHQGLRVRKPPDTKTVSRAVLKDWVEEVNGQLTAIADSSESDPGGRLRASVNQEGDLVPVRLGPEKPESRDSTRGVDSEIVMEESNGEC